MVENGQSVFLCYNGKRFGKAVQGDGNAEMIVQQRMIGSRSTMASRAANGRETETGRATKPKLLRARTAGGEETG